MSAMSPAGDGAIGTGLTATRAHASKDVIDTPEKRIVPDGGDNLASVSSTETRDLHSELDRVKANSADPDEGIPNLNEPWAVGIAIGSIQPGSQDNGTPPRSVSHPDGGGGEFYAAGTVNPERGFTKMNAILSLLGLESLIKTHEISRPPIVKTDSPLADIAPANEPTTTTLPSPTTTTHLATPEVSSFLKGIDLIKLPRSVSEEFVISSSAGGEYPSDTDHGDSQAPDSQPQQKPSLSGKASLTNIALRHADSDECSEVYRNLNYQEDHNHEVPKTWPRAASSSEPSNGRFRFSFSGLRKKLFGTKVTKPINKQQSPVSTAVSSPNPGPGSKINPGTTTTNKKKSRLSVIHKWRCRFWGLKKVETRVGPAGPEPFDTESGKTYLDCLDELKTENEMISIRDEEPPNEPLPFVAGAAQKPSGMFLPTNIEIMSGDGYRMRAGMSIETCRNLPKDHGPIGDFIHPSCIKPDKEELLGIEKSATQDDTTPSQMFFETFFNRLRATVEHHPQQQQTSTTTLSRRASKTNEDETCVRNSWSADTWEGEPPAHGFYVERNQEDVSHHGESLRKSSSETATHLEHLCNSPAGKLSPADLEFGPMRWFTRTETYVRRRSLSHNYDESDSECSSTTGHSFVGHPCREPYEHLSQEIVCHAPASEQRIRGESSREESPALSGHSSQSINEGFVSRLPELCSELESEPDWAISNLDARALKWHQNLPHRSLKPATMARHQGGFLHYDDGDKALCSEPLPAQYQLRVPH
ncbi:unnamed protein product, partial [Notodromas monacha]